jgi:hypothetical protein
MNYVTKATLARRLHPGAPEVPLMRQILIVVFLFLAAAPAVQAQQGESVAEYIARTAEILEWSAELVNESDSPTARQVLSEAQALHRQSQQHQAAGRPRQALATSRRARTAAQHAAQLARESRGHEERARIRLDRYREFHDQLLDRAREAGDQLALRFLDESEQQAVRARDQLRQGNFEMALNLLEPAEGLLARAARVLFEGGGAPRLERELERAEALIERAEDSDLRQSAREALARARQLAAEGQILRALQASRLAVRLAAQAVAAGDALTAEAVNDQLARWDDRHTDIADAVAASGSREAAQVLASARHHRDQAQRMLAASDLEAALRQIKAAFDLLNEASELAR